MTTNTKSIVWFREVGKDDIALVGGKGANLGELERARIPVPPGFIVSADTYAQFLRDAGLMAPIQRCLTDLDVNDSERLQVVATEIRDLITAAEMPPSIAAQIREAYAELGEGPVAVRSSATAEDLPEASFAGQQATFLNVVGPDNVVEAVKQCWASLFEARAIFYREDGGWDHLSVSLAVPVQRMVQSEISGVLFTVEPIHSDPTKIVVEAVYGLGEAIVSGEVSPDHYEVAKDGMAITKREIAAQERALVRNPDIGAGEPANTWIAITDERANAPKLTDAQVREIAEIGLAVEAHYGAPQDIEWAWADGRFYLTQTRPVTTIADGGPIEIPMPDIAQEPVVTGSPASPGIATGAVKVILDPADVGLVEPGDVLVAEMTTPDFVPAMKRAAAIVTDRGGRTCHAAIISRELGVPCVVGADGSTTALAPGTTITVDGTNGRVFGGEVTPLLGWWTAAQKAASQEADVETTTRIYVNLAEPELADVIAKRRVDGVGLLRAEFMVAQIGEHPRSFMRDGRAEEYVSALEAGLRKFAAAFAPRPIIYRTTDFKTNEYANLRGGADFEPHEENPMIGYRGAIRYILEPDVFALEVEAIQRVRKDYPNLHAMIPFVRTPGQLRLVKALLAEAGLVQSPDFKLWMMVEVPSNVLLLDEFLDEGIDGVSIGSNDLTQLILGIDRDSEKLASGFDERDPAVLRALEHVITTCQRRGVTVSICGQGPSEHPDLTERLVRWGVTSVSVTPDVIDKTRRLVAQAEAQLNR